jgi:hypothetical protein
LHGKAGLFAEVVAGGCGEAFAGGRCFAVLTSGVRPGLSVMPVAVVSNRVEFICSDEGYL